MDRQIAVRMPAQLAMRLDRVARRTGKTRSDVTREALERFLAGPDLTTRPIDRVRDLIGAIESGLPDVGQRHRDYLLRQVRRVR
jgi:metal-responsive CopG/Arc/MetJ family transcriptional regulator